MSERLVESAEFEPALIASALSNWLQAEIENSMSESERNSILDDWVTFQHDLQIPFEASGNQGAGKARGHYDRLFSFTMGAERYPDLWRDDYFLARQIFCTQMFMSGAYRKQCFMEADNAEDYIEHRKNRGPLAIDLRATVANRLNEYGSEMEIPEEVPYKDSPEARLRESTLRTNEESREISEQAHNLGLRYRGVEDSPATHLLRLAQVKWARLAIDYIIFAAQNHDNQLTAIPFLEPTSISNNPQIYYPFLAL